MSQSQIRQETSHKLHPLITQAPPTLSLSLFIPLSKYLLGEGFLAKLIQNNKSKLILMLSMIFASLLLM